MRKEIENWWKQANIDLKNAEMNYENGAYYVAVFLCQQATEKALKTYYMLVKKTPPELTHSLIYLANETGVPGEFFDFLAGLTPEFVTTRYPDAAGDVPANLYTKNNTKEILDETKRFIEWLEGLIKTR